MFPSLMAFLVAILKRLVLIHIASPLPSAPLDGVAA